MRIALERRPAPAQLPAANGAAAAADVRSSPHTLPERQETRETQELVAIITPRTNTATITPAENLFAAISLAEPFALEIAAHRDERWFLARAGSVAMGRHLEEQLGVAYPQAELRRLDTQRCPAADPAWRRPGEQVAASTLVLRGPQYLPLRTFTDMDLAAGRAAHAAQSDPVLGILGAMGNLPEGWRVLSQVVLRPAPDSWCKDYARLAVEHPLAHERAAGSARHVPAAHAGGLGPGAILALLATGTIVAHGYHWYAEGDWLRLALLTGGLPGALGSVLWLRRRLAGLSTRPLYDMRLVQEKLSRIAYATQIRLAVFAPADTPSTALQVRLQQLTAAYRQFSLATGNGFVSLPLHLPTASELPSDAGDGQVEDRPAPQGGRELCALRPIGFAGPLTRLVVLPGLARLPGFAGLAGAAGGAGGACPVLNVRELAGLWHLPQAQADVPLVERTTARQRLPLPGDVARGCPIGLSSHQGRSVPVALTDELLRRHLLLVAKTGRGKSSLLLHLFRHLVHADGRGATEHTGATADGTTSGNRAPCVVLIDPHRDLARAALGLVPPHRRGDVVYLDVSEPDRPFGLNLIDVGLGWERDKAVDNVLDIYRREFAGNWGPRMEDSFRYGLRTLFEANEAICAGSPCTGRDRQYTVLDVPTVLADPAFRRTLLGLVRDPQTRRWWLQYKTMDRHFIQEVINPVQTKTQKFAGSRIGSAIAGQPRSTIDPRAWLRQGSIVVVNTARGAVGADTAALIGGSIFNLLRTIVAEQAVLEPAQRRRVYILVDEFHTIPGADYESVLSELAKYGASLVLATQSLAQLDALDRQHGRTLRPLVFANIDGLFAFHCSAEDARYLVRELGGGLDESDLLELGEYRCYAKLSARGERLPAFSVRLDPPPPGEPTVCETLIAASRGRYGRNYADIEADLRAALARVEQAHTTATAYAAAAEEPGGAAASASARDRVEEESGAPAAEATGRRLDPANHGDAPVTPTGTSGATSAKRRRQRSRGQRKTEAHGGSVPPAAAEGVYQVPLPGTEAADAEHPGAAPAPDSVQGGTAPAELTADGLAHAEDREDPKRSQAKQGASGESGGSGSTADSGVAT